MIKMCLLHHAFLPTLMVTAYLLWKPTSCASIKKDVKFYLWTRQNPENHETWVFDDDFNKNYLDHSALNTSVATKIYIHGYLSNGKKEYVKVMKDAFLQTGWKKY